MARPPGRASGLRRLVAALLLLATAAVAVLVAVAVLRPQTLWTPDGRDLADSLQRNGEGIGVPDPCVPTSGDRWLCLFEIDPGSGPAGEYRLTLGDDRCWTARRTRRFDSNERGPLSGCLQVLDYVVP